MRKQYLGNIHTNLFSKVPVFIFPKTKQIILIHTSVSISFSTIHAKTLENDENDWDQGLRNTRTDGPIWTGTNGMWRFSRHPFHLSTLETKRFQKSPRKHISVDGALGGLRESGPWPWKHYYFVYSGLGGDFKITELIREFRSR